jgi:hypothetical protein
MEAKRKYVLPTDYIKIIGESKYLHIIIKHAKSVPVPLQCLESPFHLEIFELWFSHFRNGASLSKQIKHKHKENIPAQLLWASAHGPLP